MVSIIKVTSVQDTSGNNETTTANIKKAYDGAAKVFCVWDASSGTPTSLQTLNVSSLTDTGTGKCGINYTNNMSDTDNVISGGVGHGGSKGWMYDNNASSSVQVETQNISGTPAYTDYNNVSVATHGELA